MNCPIDGTELRISERQGIEIDYCPKCRGIWLDRGELDKLLERSAQMAPVEQRVRSDDDDRSRRDDEYRRRDDDYRRRDDEYRGNSKKRRARSFLEDILDFD